jgi:hypothetical protein
MNTEAKTTFYAACGGGGAIASLESVKTALSKYPSLLNEILEESVRIISTDIFFCINFIDLCFCFFSVKEVL